MVRRGGTAVLRVGECVTPRVFNSNNATSAALAEVCALLRYIYFNQSINLFASDHMDPYHNKRKYNEMIK